MQSVSQLHQDHPDVARHRQQHLAEIFRLRVFLLIWNSSRSSLDKPSTKSATGLPKLICQFQLGNAGVFHHIVQQRLQSAPDGPNQSARIEATAIRMGNVGFTALAELPFVRTLAVAIRSLDQLDILGTR